jgi:hypothetical protein
MCVPPHLRASAAAGVARGRPTPPSDATPPFPPRARRHGRWMERAVGRWRHRRRSRMRMRMRANELGAAKGTEPRRRGAWRRMAGAMGRRARVLSRVKSRPVLSCRVECVFTPGAWGEPTVHTCDASASAGSWPEQARRRRVPTRVVLPYNGADSEGTAGRGAEATHGRPPTCTSSYFVFVRGVRMRAKM